MGSLEENCREHFCIGATEDVCPFSVRQLTAVQDQYPGRQWSVQQMEHEAPERPRVRSESEKRRVIHEVEKHLLVVSNAAAALADAEANSKRSLT